MKSMSRREVPDLTCGVRTHAGAGARTQYQDANGTVNLMVVVYLLVLRVAHTKPHLFSTVVC